MTKRNNNRHRKKDKKMEREWNVEFWMISDPHWDKLNFTKMFFL